TNHRRQDVTQSPSSRRKHGCPKQLHELRLPTRRGKRSFVNVIAVDEYCPSQFIWMVLVIDTRIERDVAGAHDHVRRMFVRGLQERRCSTARRAAAAMEIGPRMVSICCLEKNRPDTTNRNPRRTAR